MNISSDKVFLHCWAQEYFLERNGIEDQLGEVLVKLWKQEHFEKVYLLNGPWGFTNLRVGAICLNLLNALVGNQISFYSFSKIDLFKFEYLEQKNLPQYGIIYIGQRRNIRLWDFDEDKKICQTNFEDLEWVLQQKKIRDYQYFCDLVYDEAYYPRNLQEKAISAANYFKFMQEYIQAKDLSSDYEVHANYMMDPIITPSKKHF